MVFVFIRFYSSVTHVLVSLQLPHVWCNVIQLEAFFAISNFGYINSGVFLLALLITSLKHLYVRL